MRRTSFLIADDSPTVRKLIARIIETHFGSEAVFTAENGKQAYEIFEREDIDIVVSDWDMPVMNGEELLFKIRQESGKRDAPFLMVTSHGERDFIVTAIQNGVSQYIVKPFTPEEMEQKLLLCWNAAGKRRGRRYSALPRHQLTVSFDQVLVHANVVDISQVGALLELDYRDEIRLFKPCSVKLEVALPGVPVMLAIDPIRAVVVRLEACDSFHPNSRRCCMALYFSPVHTDKSVQEKLGKLIKWLHSRLPDAVDDQAALPPEEDGKGDGA